MFEDVGREGIGEWYEESRRQNRHRMLEVCAVVREAIRNMILVYILLHFTD